MLVAAHLSELRAAAACCELLVATALDVVYCR